MARERVDAIIFGSSSQFEDYDLFCEGTQVSNSPGTLHVAGGNKKIGCVAKRHS